MPASQPVIYRVVIHRQGRRSIWPAHRPVPHPWSPEETTGTREECLAHIAQTAAGPMMRGTVDDAPAAQGTHFEARRTAGAPAEQAGREARRTTPAGIQFGLMFFGGEETAVPGNCYHLLLEAARFADAQGFSSIWLPERHFTNFGALYPSPAVLHAAIARHTQRVRLRAGSVVMPLHNPIRVAEDWAVVDNLSGGRVDLSFASGWHPDDFALRPEVYQTRYDEMYRGIETVRRLWRGEKIEVKSGSGKSIQVRTYPQPLQPELNFWLTAAGSAQTFEKAGELGGNILTHLFDQGVEDLARKIEVYRQARARCGYQGPGCVTVTLHTFLSDSLDTVRKRAGGPYCRFLKSNLGLLKSLAFSKGKDIDVAQLPPDQLDELLQFVFEKFLGGRSLLGTPETGETFLQQLAQIGVNEIACLLDFGPAVEDILAALPSLGELKRRVA